MKTLKYIKPKYEGSKFAYYDLVKKTFGFNILGQATMFIDKLTNDFNTKTNIEDSELEKYEKCFHFEIEDKDNYWNQENIDKRQAEYNEANAWYESLPEKEKRFVDRLARVTASGAFA